ncbi:MAG TPA: sugar ABC transporter ATP-binding protein [Blastocatellia bacterium]
MSDPVLELMDITKSFPGVKALDNVSLRVMPGDILAVVGENGAGKSTLMKIMGGIHQPDSGQILLDGRPAVFHTTKESIAAGIALIHQELSVLDNLDVAGNIFLGREPLKGGPLRLVDQRRIHAEARVYLDRLGLNVSTRASVCELSIAQRQMVEIAKALSQNARALIMDEPTSSLTLTETARLLQLIKELKSQSVSIIYVSHRLSEIQEIADRVEVLRDGKNAGSLAREEISHDRMIKLMVGRDIAPGHSEVGDTSEGVACFEVRGFRTRRYPSKPVSLSVRRGEILTLAGLVGAGRSELAQAIFGVDRPVGGSVAIDRAEVKITSPSDAISHGIYLVPEDRRQCGLITSMSVRENVTLPALARFATADLINFKRERDSATEACLRMHVKTPSIETRAANLSGGNQQKVVLAKWLGLSPKVLIFDEPTRGIDVGAKAEIYKSMRDLTADGVAVLVISSDMEEVLWISDRVAVMHEGTITGILDRKDCSEEAIMRLAVGKGGDDYHDSRSA